jgi:hypothetical protein
MSLARYIVAHTAPYYPDVQEALTWDEAVAVRDAILRERESADGLHEAKVYIAEIRYEGAFRADH